MSVLSERLDKHQLKAVHETGGNVSTDYVGDNSLQYYYASMLSLIQYAALNGIVPCQAALGPMFDRVYLHNGSGGDVVIYYSKQNNNGFPYVISNGVTYAMNRSTRDFFKEKALEQGVTLTNSTLVQYLITGNAITFGS